MAVTIRDESVVSVLAFITGSEIEIRSSDGLLLGHFTPAPRPGRMFPESGISDEEMIRRANDPDPTHWRTGEEVMARLRSLRESA